MFRELETIKYAFAAKTIDKNNSDFLIPLLVLSVHLWSDLTCYKLSKMNPLFYFRLNHKYLYGLNPNHFETQGSRAYAWLDVTDKLWTCIWQLILTLARRNTAHIPWAGFLTFVHCSRGLYFISAYTSQLYGIIDVIVRIARHRYIANIQHIFC